MSPQSGFPNVYYENVMKTLFAMEHNRIAHELKLNNSEWNDEMMKCYFLNQEHVLLH